MAPLGKYGEYVVGVAGAGEAVVAWADSGIGVDRDTALPYA